MQEALSSKKSQQLTLQLDKNGSNQTLLQILTPEKPLKAEYISFKKTGMRKSLARISRETRASTKVGTRCQVAG